jgi:hypothetical protein
MHRILNLIAKPHAQLCVFKKNRHIFSSSGVFYQIKIYHLQKGDPDTERQDDEHLILGVQDSPTLFLRNNI